MAGLFTLPDEIESLEKATQLLHECKESLFKLFDMSPACMSLTTPERIFVKVNKKFLDRFGYTEKEIIGRNALELGMLDPEEMGRVWHLLRSNGRLHNDMVTCITKDGKYVYTISSIEAVVIAGKTYMMSSFLDISKMIDQQNIIERQNKDIIDSINYARLIQNAILPSYDKINNIFPDSFVLSKPRDVLSGDFYWFKKAGNRIHIAVCDCTGHGVPAALISIVGSKLLGRFTSEYSLDKPADILNQLNKEFVLDSKNDDQMSMNIKDGMDVSLCTIDLDSLTMEYAGAYNPIYMVRHGELQKLEVDKIPIHLFTNNTGQQFNNHTVQLQKDDCLYLFSDGYADQFGGPFGKKFQSKQFQELVLKVHDLPMQEQKTIFDDTIEAWREASSQAQTDDILVMGFKV